MTKLNLSKVKNYHIENQRRRLAKIKLANYLASVAYPAPEKDWLDKLEDAIKNLGRLIDWHKHF